MDIKELQKKLVGIIAEIPAISEENELKREKKRAIEIINKLKNHINDDIEYSGLRMTALAYITKCYNPVLDKANREALAELEAAIRKVRGKIFPSKHISFLAKLPLYAILPMATLSFCSTSCFIAQSVILGGDIRIAGYLSIFALLVCIGLGTIIKKSGVLLEEKLRRIEEELNNIPKEEESDKMIKLCVDLSPHTAACLSVPSIFTGLLSLISFAVVLGKDIKGANTQAALSFFMFGSLISALGAVAALTVYSGIFDVTTGQAVDLAIWNTNIMSVTMENSLRRNQQIQAS